MLVANFTITRRAIHKHDINILYKLTRTRLLSTYLTTCPGMKYQDTTFDAHLKFQTHLLVRNNRLKTETFVFIPDLDLVGPDNQTF